MKMDLVKNQSAFFTVSTRCKLIRQMAVAGFTATFLVSFFCLELAAQTTPNIKGDADTVIVNTDIVSFNVTITDSVGRHVKGLKKDAFTVYDNNEKQQIEFFSNDDSPASVCVIFDFSGSMSSDKLTKAKNALSRFMENGHESDEYFLIGFNDRVRLLKDGTQNPDEILNAFILADAKGKTALFDACYLGVNKLLRATHNKKIILLVSDGQDNNSRYSFKDVKEMLKESDVSIYSIAVQNSNDVGTFEGINGLINLKELSDISGGLAFLPKENDDLEQIFNYIAIETRLQYSIAYRPSNFQMDGKWHKVKVKVSKIKNFPSLFVRTRQGYYARPKG